MKESTLMYFESGDRGLIYKPYGSKFVVVPGTKDYPSGCYLVERITEFDNHKKATLTKTDEMTDLTIKDFIPLYLDSLKPDGLDNNLFLMVEYVNGKSLIVRQRLPFGEEVYTLDLSGNLVKHKCNSALGGRMTVIESHEMLYEVLRYISLHIEGKDLWDFPAILKTLSTRPSISSKPKGLYTKGAALIVYSEHTDLFGDTRGWIRYFDYNKSTIKCVAEIGSSWKDYDEFTNVLVGAKLNLKDTWVQWCEDNMVAIPNYGDYYRSIADMGDVPASVLAARKDGVIDFVMYEESTPLQRPVFVFTQSWLGYSDLTTDEVKEVADYVQNYNNEQLGQLLLNVLTLNKFPWDV